jgi:hypothetical protein
MTAIKKAAKLKVFEALSIISLTKTPETLFLLSHNI